MLLAYFLDFVHGICGLGSRQESRHRGRRRLNQLLTEDDIYHILLLDYLCVVSDKIILLQQMLFLNVLSAFINLKKLNLPNVPIAYIDIFVVKRK